MQIQAVGGKRVGEALSEGDTAVRLAQKNAAEIQMWL
jgi:hypothetical protein